MRAPFGEAVRSGPLIRCSPNWGLARDTTQEHQQVLALQKTEEPPRPRPGFRRKRSELWRALAGFNCQRPRRDPSSSTDGARQRASVSASVRASANASVSASGERRGDGYVGSSAGPSAGPISINRAHMSRLSQGTTTHGRGHCICERET